MYLTTKAWWQSKTIIGGAVAVTAGLFGLFGVDIDAPTQESIVHNLVAIGSSLGGLVAIYGRLKAKHTLGTQPC
jgi:hypothetical protein